MGSGFQAIEAAAKEPNQLEHVKRNFPIGNTVLLKSGSPALTVTYVRDNGNVDVEWYDDDGTVQRHCFHPDMLVRV